jgi:hypothetical protein
MKGTTLATPDVKKKNEMYYGSPATSKASGSKSATLGNTGVVKVWSFLCYLPLSCKLFLTVHLAE